MNPQQQEGGAGNCLNDINKWWSSVPIGTKSIYVTTTAVYLMGFFVNIAQFLYSSPNLIMNFQFWRLFTAQFVEINIFGLIFGLLSIYFSAVTLEKTIGTIPFLIDFMFKNLMIQLFNLAITLLLNLAGLIDTDYKSFGLFNIVILYISLSCFSDPETSTRFLCFPIQLKNKFQPIAIFIFFSLLSGMIRLDFIASIILGFIEVKCFGGMMLRLKPTRIDSLKNSFIFRSMSNRYDFIDPNSQFLINKNQQHDESQDTGNQNFKGHGVSIGGDLTNPQGRQNQYQYSSNPTQYNQQSNGQSVDFQQFAGKGVSIGGGPNGNTLTQQQQRELHIQKLQQQKQQEQNMNEMKQEVDTQPQTSNQSSMNTLNIEQNNQQKKDGYSTLREELL